MTRTRGAFVLLENAMSHHSVLNAPVPPDCGATAFLDLSRLAAVARCFTTAVALELFTKLDGLGPAGG